MQDSPTLGDILTWAEKLCIHTCQETHIHTDMVAPSCSRTSRRSVVLRGPDDSAHSFLAEPSLSASHHSDKQDSTPAYLTRLIPLLYYLLFYMGPLNTRSFRLRTPAACHRYMTPEALNPLFMRSRFQTFHVNAITHQTPDSQSLKHNKAGPVFPLFRNWHLNFCNKYQPCPGAVWSVGTQATLHNCSGPVSDSNLQQWADGAPLHTAAWHTPPKKCYLRTNIE